MSKKRIILGLVLLGSGIVGLVLLEDQNDIIYPLIVLMIALYALFPQLGRVTDPQALEMEAFRRELDAKQVQIDKRNYQDLVMRSALILKGSAVSIEKVNNDAGDEKFLLKLRIKTVLKGALVFDADAEIDIVARHLPELNVIHIWFLVPEGEVYRSIHRTHWPLWTDTDLGKITEFL